MIVKDLGFISCFIMQIMAFLIIVFTIIYYSEHKLKNNNSVKKKNKRLILIIIILSISSLIIASIFYNYSSWYLENNPDRGFYEFKVLIKNENDISSNIELDLPLPHNERIYSNIEFFTSYEMDTMIDSDIQSLNYKIKNSTYGTVLHIVTNKTLFIYSNYRDIKNEIDISIKLSTQDNDVALANLLTDNSQDISIILFYSHMWYIDPYLGFSTKTNSISISKNQYAVPDKISDYKYETKYRNKIFIEKGTDLFTGWNHLNTSYNEYIVMD